LAIVETLKEFRNILLGQQIIVYTDHKNLTYKVFNTEHVMRWRMIAEQFGAELRYIQGEKNIVADTLSRLDLEPSLETESDPSVLDNPNTRKLADAFATQQAPTRHDRNLPNDAFPISFKEIQKEQQKDNNLKKKVQTHKFYVIRNFHGETETGCSFVTRIRKENTRCVSRNLCNPK